MDTQTATLEAVIDDYFHMLVRSHPWDKKRFEAVLEPLNEWFEARHGAPAPLAVFTSSELEEYFATLSFSERDGVYEAVRDFCVWAATWGWLEQDLAVVESAI